MRGRFARLFSECLTWRSPNPVPAFARRPGQHSRRAAIINAYRTWPAGITATRRQLIRCTGTTQEGRESGLRTSPASAGLFFFSSFDPVGTDAVCGAFAATQWSFVSKRTVWFWVLSVSSTLDLRARSHPPGPLSACLALCHIRWDRNPRSLSVLVLFLMGGSTCLALGAATKGSTSLR